MSKRILVVAKAFPPNLGGVETYSEQVAFAYARRGFEPVVLTQYDGPARVDYRTRGAHSIEVHNVGSGPQILVFLRMYRAIRRLRDRGFDCVHATTWRVSLPVLLARLGPLIVTLHGREIMQTKGPLGVLMRHAILAADQRGVISQYSLRICSEKIPELLDDAVVAWNGLSWPDIDSRPRARPPGAPLRILTACQLTTRKNVSAGINAIRLLRDRGIGPVEYRIAGDGPERENLEALVRESSLGDQITFLGYVQRDHMPEQYGWADVFLHPQTHSHDSADFESFCIAVADAMGYGLPTIAGRDGAPSEYIEHDVNGWLVSGLDPAEVADIIATALTSEEHCRKVGENAALLSREQFSWDRHVDTLLAFEKD